MQPANELLGVSIRNGHDRPIGLSVDRHAGLIVRERQAARLPGQLGREVEILTQHR